MAFSIHSMSLYRNLLCSCLYLLLHSAFYYDIDNLSVNYYHRALEGMLYINKIIYGVSYEY